MRNKYCRNIIYLLLLGAGIGLPSYISFARQQFNLLSSSELAVVHNRLKQFNSQEIQDLGYFLEYVNKFCQYPYTLTGYKPMSICNYLQESDDLPPLFRAEYERSEHRIHANTLERGYQVFKKHCTAFPSPSHLVVLYHASNSKGRKEIALIHRDACLGIIERHIDDFRTLLYRSVSANEVLEILTSPEHAQFYRIVQHNRLLGILLGYGRNNAYLFENSTLRSLSLDFFTHEWPVWPRQWRLPGFLCDHASMETKRLKKSYKTARKYIFWTYFNRNHAEVTLGLLAKESITPHLPPTLPESSASTKKTF